MGSLTGIAILHAVGPDFNQYKPATEDLGDYYKQLDNVYDNILRSANNLGL